MYKRWEGNSGRVRRVAENGGFAPPKAEEAKPPFPPGPVPPPPAPRPAPPPPGPVPPPAGLFGELGSLLRGLRRDLETEDLLLGLILYLLYRESGDTEWLFALGAMLLLE